MAAPQIISKTADGPNPSLTMTIIVETGDTVGAVVDGMPMVAATPYLVKIAEVACYRLAEPLLESGQITVGSRVVIDHLGPSKVGAALLIEAALRERIKNRFHFDVRIHDGDRLVATVEHIRAAVSREKIMSALG
jgi:predicted thioesterase